MVAIVVAAWTIGKPETCFATDGLVEELELAVTHQQAWHEQPIAVEIELRRERATKSDGASLAV